MSRSTTRQLWRGEVWLANLEPSVPGEQGRTRPVLIVSANAFNSWPVGLVAIVPITSTNRGLAHHVPVEGDVLPKASYAMPEYLRIVTSRRLIKRLGASDATLEALEPWLRAILDLPEDDL